jgi:PAS domain S-box-containing protein
MPSALEGLPKSQVEGETLRRNYEELKHFVESATTPLHTVGPDGIIKWANDAELNFLGFSRAEYFGHHISEFHADAAVIADILTRLASGERLKDFPARLKTRSGEIKQVLIDSCVLWENGRFVHTQCFTRDITDRRRSEDAPRESEERYRTLFTSAPMAILACDREGVVQHYNRRAVELWGREPARGQERHSGSARLWRPDGTFLPREESPMVEVLRTGIPIHDVELFIERPDGSRLAVLVNFDVLKDAEGEITGAIASFVDIDERKHTETNLAFLASISQDLAQHSRVDGMMRSICARIGAYLHLSLCNFVEISETDDRAVCSHEWHRNDIPGTLGAHHLSDFVTDAFLTSCRGGEIIVIRDTAADPRTDAEKYALFKIRSFVCVPLVRDNHWRFLFNVHHSEPHQWRPDEIDLIRELAVRIWTRLERFRGEEELRHSEERFRFMAESMPQKIYTATPAGDLDYFNRQWTEYTGQTFEQIRNQGWQEFVESNDLKENLSRWKSSIATGKSYESQYRLRRKDGVYRWHVSRAHALRDPGGKVLMWIGSSTDIDDQKRAGEKLEQMVAERTASLREAVAQMEEFSYSVSHDLRAPVRAIQGFARAAIEDCGDRLGPEGGKYLSQIVRSSVRMDRLIQDVLVYSKLAQHQIQLQPVSLDALIPEIIGQYPEMQSPLARISLCGPLGSVLAHESSLSQAISNLLRNAVKFVKEGSVPEIEISTSTNQGRVKVSIHDNGIGIPSQYQARLFGMFERLHRGGQFEGTGIGLAIVRKAIEKMGGQIGVESDGSSGSTFWFELAAPAADS